MRDERPLAIRFFPSSTSCSSASPPLHAMPLGVEGLVPDPRFYVLTPKEWADREAAAKAEKEREETETTQHQQEQPETSNSSTFDPQPVLASSTKRPSSPSFRSPPLKTPRLSPTPHPPSPAKQQPTYLGADIPRPPNSRYDAAGWPVCPPGMERPRYAPEDFQSRSASPEQIKR
jgi:hypothetical protein